MSSISPASSASNAACQASLVLSPVLLIEQLAEFSVSQRCEIMCEYYKACTAASGGLDRDRSVCSSVSESVVSVVTEGGSVDYLSQVGKCYLRAIKREHRKAVYENLGVEPTLRQLLRLPRSLYLPDSILRKVRVECGFTGVHHLADAGSYDFLQVVNLLAGTERWPAASLARKGKMSDGRALPDLVADIKLDDRLGTPTECVKGVEVSMYDLIKPQYRDGFAQRVRSGEYLSVLLSYPMDWFRSRSELVGYGVWCAGQGYVDLVLGGGQVSWLRFATHYAQTSGDYRSGSLGSALQYADVDDWQGYWSIPLDPKVGNPLLPDYQLPMWPSQLPSSRESVKLRIDEAISVNGLSDLELSSPVSSATDERAYFFVEEEGFSSVDGSSGRVVLTDDIRAAIYEHVDAHPGETQKQVAKIFGVDRSTISKLLRKRRIKAKSVSNDHGFEPGFCYLQLVSSDKVAEVESLLGPWPLVQDVLALPEAWLDINKVSSMTVEKTGEFRLHVRGGATDFPSWNVFMREHQQGLAKCCRVGGAVDMKMWMIDICPKVKETVPDEVFRLVSSTAAMHKAVGKRKLKMLEAMGDSAISAALAKKCCSEQRSAQEYQEARSFLTSNVTLTAWYAEKVPSSVVSFPAGVDPTRGNVGAYVMEAVLGVIALHCGLDEVEKVCDDLQLFAKYSWD